MPITDRKLRVFLCHASQDKPVVRELYQRLLAEGWIDPWLDEEKLLPGEDWDLQIEKTLEFADAVVVCLSNSSVTKEGYVQRELRFVLDIALEKPEGTIFLIPLRLNNCEPPRRLRSWQYVDYFPAARRDRAYQRLLEALKTRHIGQQDKPQEKLQKPVRQVKKKKAEDSIQKELTNTDDKAENIESVKYFPPYNRDQFKIWALPHPLLLHWILNPGLVFNELILGQRIPKVQLIDKTIDKPILERTFVPCPHCGSLHDGRLWGKKNGFGHWFGYVCPSCGEIIPCLWNVASLLVLFITSPLWYFFADSWKKKWIEYEKKRFNSEFEESKNIPWIQVGIMGFGGLMFWVVGVIPQIINLIRGNAFDWNSLLILIPICIFGGFLFGAMMKFWANSK